MSVPPTPNRSRGSVTAPAEAGRERSLSVSAIQKAQRGSRRDSVLPLCMSRDQHAALHASPAASQTASKYRKHRGSGASSGKLRQQTPLVASPLATSAVTTANGWMALLAHPEANPEIARAVQMCSLYPTLRVAGTAFENSLNMAHRLSVESFTLLSSSRRGTEVNNGSFSAPHRDEVPRSPRMSTSVLMETSSVLREATEEWRAFHDGANGSSGTGGNGSFHTRNSVLVPNSASAADAVSRTIAMNGGTKMVQMACAMKRAAMWEVVVVTALAHRAMELKFRRDRLRRVLERHLLPTLVERKKTTGSVLAKRGGAARRNNNNTNTNNNRDPNDESTNGGGADSGSAPQGSYLRDHDAFFASLNSSALLQSFAETMSRHRFLPGEVIARAGQLSQRAMYFLISGKCEVTKDRSDGAPDVIDPSEHADTAHAGIAGTPTYRDGMHSMKAPRTRQRGAADAAALSRCVKEVIMPGATFGGIFGGSAVFAETYRALSQCIVWELRAEDFEQVFRPFSDRVMLDKYKESMRAHSLGWLQQHYQPAKVFGSIPVYRKLVSRKARYLSDFVPVVKVRGELLFAQGDLPGDVYCLLEGTVLRRTRGRGGGHGNSDDGGVAQRLATNAFSSLRAVGRFLLLGEEPHILPGVQPYSCTVSSRSALFYKISGERFVSALLDDPALYAQLRERLMKQRQSTMVLHPECLAYVPLLQRFPPEKRAELVQFAQPRVVGRSASLCEPAQHLSELMLVVSGDVCDPRRYGQKPTTSLRVPASSDGEGTGGGGSSNNNANNNSGIHSSAHAEEGGGHHNNANNNNSSSTGAATRPLQSSNSFRNKNGKADRRRRETGVSAAMHISITSESDAAPAGVKRKLNTGGGANGKRASAAVKGSMNFFDADGSDDDSDADSGADGRNDDGRRSRSGDITGVEWNFSMTEAQVSAAFGGSAVTNNNNNTTSGGGGNGNASFQSINAGGETSGFGGTQRAHFAPPAATAAQQHQKLCQTAAIVHPDESEEINPPPPTQPTRTFLYALGGSWEALLLDKWPNGWETTSTVALWAIPTHKLRLVYNSCSKATQSYILNGLRLAQKEDQQLPSIPHTKLPPMTVYTQRGEGAVVVPGALETSSQTTTRSSVQPRRPARRQGDGQQHQQRGPAPSLPFAGTSDTAGSFYQSGMESSPGALAAAAVAQGEEDPLGHRKKAQRPAKANNTGGGGGATSPTAHATKATVTVPDATRGTGAEARSPRRQQQSAVSQSPPRNTSTTSPSPTPSKSKAKTDKQSGSKSVERTPRGNGEDDGTRGKAGASDRGSKHNYLRHKSTRATAASTLTPPPAPVTIDPAVKAAYDGVLDATDPLMLRIVRDPVMVTAAASPTLSTMAGGGASGSGTSSSSKRAAALAGRSLPPLAASVPPPATGVSSAAWPAQAPAQERWFQAVPSYEPLPGTVRAAETLAAPPVFAPNSTVLASAGVGPSSVHGRMLESHVAYYAATVSPTAASVTKRGGAAAGVGERSVGVSPHPLPKRRAYAA